MAKMNVVETSKEIMVPQIIKEKSFVLELSKEEAQLIADIFGYVGGDPKKSRRKLVDNIYNALSSVRILTQHNATDVAFIGSSIMLQDVYNEKK